jgi:hypothetical protein
MAWTIGDDAPTDTALVDVWVGKAERLLRHKVPDLQSRIDGGLEPDLLGNVKDVVTSMVQRVFRNPMGVRTVQESTGPLGGSVTYGGDQPGALWVTDTEFAMLNPTVSRAFMIDMIPSTSPFSANYVEPL